MRYTYSLDKIKFSFKICNPKAVCNFFLSLPFDKHSAHKYTLEDFSLDNDRASQTFGKYKYSYKATPSTGEGVVLCNLCWLGTHYDPKINPNVGFIEYNPNKDGAHLVKRFMEEINPVITDIKNCDVAFDLPNVKKSTVVVETIADVMSYGKVYNNTTYIAPKDPNGRIKIYQKDVERNDNDVRTRVEVSLSGDWLNFLSTSTPQRDANLLKIANRLQGVKFPTQCDEPLSAMEYMFSCLNAEQRANALALMNPHTRAKYRRDQQCDTLKVTPERLLEILAELLHSYTPEITRPRPRLSRQERHDNVFQSLGYQPYRQNKDMIQIESEEQMLWST